MVEIIKQKIVGCKTSNVYPRPKVLNDKAEIFDDERLYQNHKIKNRCYASNARNIKLRI